MPYTRGSLTGTGADAPPLLRRGLMGRLFVLLVVAALAGCVQSSPAAVVTPDEMTRAVSVDEIESMTVAVVQIDEDGEAGAYCSGTWVSADAILTAAHCVADMDLGDPIDYVVRADLTPGMDRAMSSHRGRLVALDGTHDLALVRVTLAPSHRAAGIATDAHAGQPVQTTGAPLGLWYSYSVGVVAAIRVLDGEHVVYVQSTAPISPGNSGGALFDRDGNLLGVCHGYFPRGENLNLYVHAQYVQAFLRGKV